MSYDVFMQAFREGGPGEASRDGAMRVIRAAGDQVELQPWGFFVTCADGGHAEVSASELSGEGEFVSTMFSIRGSFTQELAQFIYAFAREANMVLIAPDGSGTSATFACTREEQMTHVAGISGTENCPKVVISSGEEAHRLLKEGYLEWRTFAEKVRKQVAEEGKRARRTKKP